MMMKREMTGRENKAANIFSCKAMHLVLAALMVILMAAFAGRAEASNVQVDITVKYGQSEARTIVNMINKFRNSSDAWYWNSDNTTKTYCKNLVTLQYDYQLEKVAMLRAAEIALSYGHERPNGQRSFTAYDDLGYTYTWAAENIAAGYTTAAAVNEGWIEADEDYDGQGHRRAMLSNSYNAVGIAHVYYNGFHYWVEEFGIATHAAQTSADNSTQKVSISVADSKIDGLSLSFDTDPSLMKVKSVATVTSVKLDVEGQWPESLDRTVSANPSVQISNTSVEKYSSGKVVSLKEGQSTLTASLGGQKTSVNFTVHDCSKNASGSICKICGATVKANTSTTCSHVWSDWTVTKEATVLAAGQESRECLLCGTKQTQAIAKLQATIKLSVTKAALKKGKSLKIKVSMGKGDAVKSFKSSKKSVATVDKNGKITAKKKGKALITVTLKSGKKATVKVIVK